MDSGMEKPADSNHGEKRKHEEDKQAEEEPSSVRSKYSEDDLQVLVKMCLLQPKDSVYWRNALGEISPSVKESEIVLFASFLEHGLALPTCYFLLGLLYYYGFRFIILP